MLKLALDHEFYQTEDLEMSPKLDINESAEKYGNNPELNALVKSVVLKSENVVSFEDYLSSLPSDGKIVLEKGELELSPKIDR